MILVFTTEAIRRDYANTKDGQSVISFQPIGSANTPTLARTYVKDYDLWPPHSPIDRLEEVDVAFNVKQILGICTDGKPL